MNRRDDFARHPSAAGNRAFCKGLDLRASPTTNNLRTTLDKLETDHQFHAALMDIQMPVVSGLDAVKAIRIREAESGEHIPIIAVTAHAMKGDRELCLESGMDDDITKPLQATELFAALDRALNGGVEAVTVHKN